MAKFSIGIDLGTSNCALSFVRLDDPGAITEVFEIPQWDSLNGLASLTTLPSFLYLPTAAEASQLGGADANGSADWISGLLARKRSGETPGRVALSAKSWLCHHSVDRNAEFLPWGSDEIDHEEKISPIKASALLLNYLRGAWNNHFAAMGAGFSFDEQEITVTVPASFDAVAQGLTIEAAKLAGFPESMRLLEEPQAAFYRWLEKYSQDPKHLWEQLPEQPKAGENHHVLVVDIGGGTSDFSLFEINRQSGAALPVIKRLAVSDHILLGGDNIDLAIAHLAEPKLAGEGQQLSGSQWSFLTSRCRELKEHVLGQDGGGEEAFTVSLPGRGSSLLASTISTEISRTELETLLLDGFFPDCPADAKVQQADAGLKEWGLPYAADSAITRHLAEFLAGRPAIDAVLFNGGSLYPEKLRLRLQGQIASWQNGYQPTMLSNPEPDLAVARGAARYGSVLNKRSQRIEAGAARSVYLEVLNKEKDSTPQLVCILPRGAEPEQAYDIESLKLELRINRPIEFRSYYSTRHSKHAAGEMLALKGKDYHKLPPLQTIARLSNKPEELEGNSIPVKLRAKLNELGLLQIECISTVEEVEQTWPLEFNLRVGELEAETDHTPIDVDPGVEQSAIDEAASYLESALQKPAGKGRKDKLTAQRLLKELEQIFGLAKADWNWVLIRSLWPSMVKTMDCRSLSPDHEEAWLILAGFFLRPGYGTDLDPHRIDELWPLFDAGLANKGKGIKLQEYILWRRIAGGLSAERQTAIIGREIEKLRLQKNPPAELVRLAGSFERISPSIKSELVENFLGKAETFARDGKYCAPYLVSLSLLLNRTPMYAGQETVVSPEFVDKAYDAFCDLDWTKTELIELQNLFLRAARVVDNRSLDVDEKIRLKIAKQLDKAKATPLKVQRVREFIPMEQADKASLYGESLPPGLVLK